MDLPKGKQLGYFVERVNRFTVQVSLDGQQVRAHLANSGRLRELLTPGRPLYLVPRSGPGRRTHYDVALAQVGDVLVSMDARLPSKLVQEALSVRALPPFLEYTIVHPEFRYGHSRLDFLLEGRTPRCLLEVKSVTLVQGGRALFPDGPTARGRRHLEELARACAEGWRAAVVFMVQRPDAIAFGPNDSTDPEFGQVLRRVARQGVEVYSYRCRVALDWIQAAEEIPVMLDEVAHVG
ncbi:MAG: DNA/RNA nuclease SfsA [Chloroflexi bacterium]|nr:DNA/RNA nuclease SfsA [Chloroflexota bacterium]